MMNTRKTGPAMTATSSTGPQIEEVSLSFQCPGEERQKRKASNSNPVYI